MQFHPKKYADTGRTCRNGQARRPASPTAMNHPIEPSAPHTTHRQVRILARILQEKGIRSVVISSGSRNAPLTQELTGNPAFRCFSVVDERSAAFFAMGLSKHQDRPAALVCTSGSAVLNYYPAVAEAYYSRIPLIVISADRPAQWIDQAIGQTIRQDHVLAAHCAYSTSLREGDDPQTAWYNAREINRAINTACEQQAPAHLNVPLSEPLYDTLDERSACEDPSPRLIEDLPVDPVPSPRAVEQIRRLWSEARRKMILIGARRPDDRSDEVLEELARRNDVAILSETTSNLRRGKDPAPDDPGVFVRHIDRAILPLTAEQTAALQPDLLITCGGMVVSKKIKTFLQNASPRVHIHVGLHTHPDTYMSLTHCVRTDDTTFFKLLDKCPPAPPCGYARAWKEIAARREKAHRAYADAAPYSDFAVWKTLCRAIPEGSHLEIANSAAIRYSQLFDLPDGVSVGCNRGTSGIDGSSSTAVGAAVALAPRGVTLISGDLSFLYDNNALWNESLPDNLRLIVLNNGGGGIFRILNGARDSSFGRRYLQASHEITFRSLARMHSLEYFRAENAEELRRVLSDFWSSSPRARLLEVDTRACENDAVLRTYFACLGDE